MSSLVSLANDIFAADLNELQTFRDQIELRAEAQARTQEREQKIREREEQKRQHEATQQNQLQLTSEAEQQHATSSLKSGGKSIRSSGGAAHHNKNQAPNSGRRRPSSSGKNRSNKHKNAQHDDNHNDNDQDENDSSTISIPPPFNPKTDLTGIVADSRVDPFLDLVRALDNHADNVAKANAPYLKWMKQRMAFLNSRSNLVAGAEPIPEDVLGDDEKDAETAGHELAPPPLAIPLLGFTRAHADELKDKYSYSPPRGLLNAGKITQDEVENMKKDNEDQNLELKLGSHSAGETWKDPGFKKMESPRRSGSNSKSHQQDDLMSAGGTTTNRTKKQKRKIGLPQDAFSDVLSSSARTKNTRRSSIGGGTNLVDPTMTSGSDSDAGGLGRSTSHFGGDRSMSDFTEMYVDESPDAAKRREARQRQVDKFHSKMRSAVEFSTKKLVFTECLPGHVYKQQFRLWNRSNDLRRFKVQPGSNEALKKSKVAGYSNNYTFGSSKFANATSGNDNTDEQQQQETPRDQQQETTTNNNNTNTKNNNGRKSPQSEYELDGNEAYEIPRFDVKVISPANFSSEKAIAPGTAIVVEVCTRPHWSAFENVDCSIAVSHVRDVNSQDRTKNEMSQWHCEELPVAIEMCQPRLDMVGSCVVSTTSDVSFNLPTCFFGNIATEEVLVKNRGSKANFSLRLEPRVSPFVVEPTFLQLEKDEEATLKITYKPRDDQHGSGVQDSVSLTFEGSLIPSEDDQNDAASRRKGRRRVYLETVEVTGTGTDACVYVSTIGTNSANQVAMKNHRGADAIGSVNINDAVIGFSAWRPVTLQNDSDLDIPVCLDSFVTSEHPSDIVQLVINPRFAVVPAHGSCVVDLILSSQKELLHAKSQQRSGHDASSPRLPLHDQEIAGRFFLSVQTDSGVPEVAVQRAHERRFASLSEKPQRKIRNDVAVINNSKNNNNNKSEIFVEEFDVVAKPSKPALSFTPTTLDMSDVEALTNQTNVCDAILRNDGAGELTFCIVSDRALARKKNSNNSNQVGHPAPSGGMFLDKNDSSSSDEDDDFNIEKHLRKQAKLQRNQNAASSTNLISTIDKSLIGHAFDEDGGLEWWAVPSQGIIAPGIELRVSIRYSARRAGSVSANLTAFCPLLESERSPSLQLLARGRGPTIQSNVASLEFGSITYGAESECRFNLFNPSENDVFISIADGNVNPVINPLAVTDDDENEHSSQQQQQQEDLTEFQKAVRSRLVIAPSHCTLHPRQTAIVTVYLRAVNPGKNEDYVRVSVQDGTDLLIPFSGSVIVPELLIAPSTIHLGDSVDRDVVVPCSFTLSNPSCIELPFEVVPVDDLEGVCKIDLIGYESSIAAGALDVPINFTVTFTQEKDTPVSVMFAFVSNALQAPVLCKITTDAVCQPTVSLAVTLPGQALFNQSAQGFIDALLKNVVEEALLQCGSDDENEDTPNNNNNSNNDQDEDEDGVIEVKPRQKRLDFVSPFVDPIVLTGNIESGLPYCAMDFELIIKNPTGCVFPASTRPLRFPSAATAIAENHRHIQLYGDDTNASGMMMMQSGNSSSAAALMLKPAPPATGSYSTSSAAVGRSTRLPKMDGSSPARNPLQSQKSIGSVTNNKSAGGKQQAPKLPALASQTSGKTFFCRAEDGTDARDRARDELLAAASALVQTGREVAIDVSSLDDKSVDTVLNGFDTHPVNVRCLATIPGVFQDNLRLDFGTGVPSTELPVTFRVSGRPVVIDPATSAMVIDSSTGVNTLQLPSVVAGMRSVKRTIQITSRCPRDLRLDCRISVTGSSVGSALLPSDIFGGEAAVSTSLFSKEGGGPSNEMANSWATVSPQVLTLNALQSTQITIEYKPPKDAKKIPTWDGILHIQSTIVPTNFNDKFLIAEFYELHGDDFPNQRSLNPIVISEKSSASGATTVVKGVSKLPLRVPIISRSGVVDNGILNHRQAAQQILASSNEESGFGSTNASNSNNSAGVSLSSHKRRNKTANEMTDSSDDDNNNSSNRQNQNSDQQQGNSNNNNNIFIDMRAREQARKNLIAKVKRERPVSAVINNNTSYGGTDASSFDAAAHENAVQETVLVLQYLRDRYQELKQFTTGGFVLPTQLNLHVKHLHPILEVDPFPLVRLPKCVVPPVLPPTNATSLATKQQLTPLPSNVASVRLTNNGITTIDARLFLGPQTAKFFKLISFTRRHGDSRPKRAANKYDTNPIETGTSSFDDLLAVKNNNNNNTNENDFDQEQENASWISGQFKMTPQEIVDVEVALVNAQCPALQRLLVSFTSSSFDSSPPPPEAHEAAPFITLTGELELRFSNGDSQKIQLSSHVFVPKVSLVQESIEFLPTVEVSLGRGQPTLSRRITLVNASPCPAAFELTPMMENMMDHNNNTNMNLLFQSQQTHADPEGPSSREVTQATTGGARQGIAKNTAKALLLTSAKSTTAKTTTLVVGENANTQIVNNKHNKITIKPPPRREITLKAAANSVDILALTKKKMNNDDEENSNDDDDDVAIYDTGRFNFSTARGHLPPASVAGVPSRTEIDVFFEPFASSLFQAKFKVDVEGGVGSTLTVRAQSRVTEV